MLILMKLATRLKRVSHQVLIEEYCSKEYTMVILALYFFQISREMEMETLGPTG